MNPGCFRKKHDKASGKPHCAIANQHLALSAKRIGAQRRTKVALWCILCSCCSWWKGTPQDEATLSSEEIKPIALPIVELRLGEGISQLVSRNNRNLLEWFKAAFGLLPNCCKGWFWVIFLSRKPQKPPWSLIYSTTALYDIFMEIFSHKPNYAWSHIAAPAASLYPKQNRR